MKFTSPFEVDKQPQLSADHPVNGFDFGLLFFLMPSVNIGVAASKEFIIEMENCLIADFHMQISVVNRTHTHTAHIDTRYSELHNRAEFWPRFAARSSLDNNKKPCHFLISISYKRVHLIH